MRTITSNNRASSAKRRRVLSLRCFVATLACAAALSLLAAHSYVEPLPSSSSSQLVVKSVPRTESQHAACGRMKNLKDIQECYPRPLVRPLPHCPGGVTSLDDVRNCISGRFYPEDHTATTKFTLHIMGERHSGTKFLQNELQRCFPANDESRVKKVHRDFHRSKHFFQPINGGNHRTSIVIVIVRDPVEWVAAMHEKPYHSPVHVETIGDSGHIEPLPWQEFTHKPWTIPTNEVLKPDERCTDDFKQGYVKPCRVTNKVVSGIPESQRRGFYPVYEMNPVTGQPFVNILELRSAKITNHILQLPLLTSLGGFLLVRYEDLLKDGTRSFLETVSATVEHPLECDPTPPQPERLRKRFIPTAFREWIEANVDTEMEKLLGYR